MPLTAALAGAALLYTPAGAFSGKHLFGSDFLQCHQYRMEFVRELWQSGTLGLPGWYSREAFGTPFWADIQNFPWIPTRLLLFAFPPYAAFAPGVVLAACLAVLFAYLFARAIGAGRVGAAVAGFTYAGSGFFASRIMAGHLPHLEAYPALPLLLWLVERVAALDGVRTSRRFTIALGVATACVCLAGVPQLPFYAVATAGLYALWRCRGRRLAGALAAMVLGATATLFVWWPSLRLILRSARALPLARPDNDVPFPFGRIPALLFPWRDGWPAAVVREPQIPFGGYSSDAVFWETTSYVGLLPWLVAIVLLAVALSRKRSPSRPVLFVVAASLFCAVLSLQVAQQVFQVVPGTVFRSASRLWMVPVLGLALACGAGIDALWSRGRASGDGVLPFARIAALALVAMHAADLWTHARPFVRPTNSDREPRPRIEDVLARETGTYRVSLDYNLPIAPTRRYDDIGLFSSIQLGTTYRALSAMRQAKPGANFQYLSPAREMPAFSISNAGARFLGSMTYRPELEHLLTEGEVHLFAVPRPTPRAMFFPRSLARYWSEDDIYEQLRRPEVRLDEQVMLPLETMSASASESAGGRAHEAAWRRPSPDVMEVEVDAPVAGFLRVLEAHDIGWRAEVDGARASILRSDGFLLAVPLTAGRHLVRLEYRTPGARAGLAMSAAAVLLAAALVLRSHRQPLH